MKKVVTLIRAMVLAAMLAGSGLMLAEESPGGNSGKTCDYAILTDKPLQTCEGWGVSLCWWANMCGKNDEAHIDSLLEWLVSPEGLNYNVFRYNIGGGDDPHWSHCEPHHTGRGKGLRAEMEGFLDEIGGAYQWQRDEGQIRVLRMIHEKRPDAIFEAFSNSPPYFMTCSGCVAGNDDPGKDNLRSDCYEDFADYMVNVCLHIKETYGIEFATLEPFNESMSSYWKRSGSQEGCHFDVASQIAFIKVLYPKLKASGLKTVISASDETNIKQSIQALTAYAEAGILHMIGQWNTHTYEGSAADKERLRTLADSLHIKLWQSETGSGGKGIQGNLNMAGRLIEDIKCLQPAVWADWQYVEVNNTQWSLVIGSSDWAAYHRHANYYIRQHFSRFIPTGYRFVETSNPHALAALSPDGQTLVHVALNATESIQTFTTAIPAGAKLTQTYLTDISHRLSLLEPSPTPKQADGITTLALPPQSIVTQLFSLQ